MKEKKNRKIMNGNAQNAHRLTECLRLVIDHRLWVQYWKINEIKLNSLFFILSKWNWTMTAFYSSKFRQQSLLRKKFGKKNGSNSENKGLKRIK